jgi:dUTPase
MRLYIVKRGDRIAQLIIEKISAPEIIEVDVSIYSTF